MNIRYANIDSIKPYANNAKVHSDEQIEHIANSIKRFGFQQPIVIDRNGVIVIGHGRYFAARMLEISQVPVVDALGLNDDQIKALRLADNKTNESAWDYFLLAAEISGITEIDMSEFGFELASDEEKEQKFIDSDEIDLDNFGDEQFKYVCPCCGFRFNKGGK